MEMFKQTKKNIKIAGALEFKSSANPCYYATSGYSVPAAGPCHLDFLSCDPVFTQGQRPRSSRNGGYDWLDVIV